MPLIIFEGPAIEEDKKRELVRSFAEAVNRATGVRKEAVITIIHENDKANVGVGAELLPDKLARESGDAGGG